MKHLASIQPITSLVKFGWLVGELVGGQVEGELLAEQKRNEELSLELIGTVNRKKELEQTLGELKGPRSDREANETMT